MNIYKIINHLIITLLVTSMFFPCITVSAQNGYLMDLQFEDVETNGAANLMETDGSVSARVVEDGEGNKAFTAETGFIDNTVTVNFPQEQKTQQYFVQFDIKFTGKAASGSVRLKNAANTNIQLIKIDENGSIFSFDGKRIGGTGIGSYTTVGALIDLEYGFLTIYLDGKIKLSKWKISNSIPLASMLLIETDRTGASSSLFLDRIRLYDGIRYMDNKTSIKYNPSILDYTPVDESKNAEKVYINNNFDAISDLGVSVMPKTNSITGIKDEKTKNGYVEIKKTTSSDSFIDISLPPTSKYVVIEADFRYDSQLMPSQAFYLRDNISNSTVENISLASLADGKVTAGGASAAMSKKKWAKVSISLNLKKNLYNVYVNDKILVKEKSFSEKFKTVSLWRIYIGGGADNGDLLIDNIKAYDGEAPRDISNEKKVEISKFTDDETIAFLKGKTALQAYSNKLFAGNQKQDVDIPCIIAGNEVLVSPKTMEKLFTEPVNVTGNIISVGSAIMTKDIKEIKVDGKTIPIEAAPQEINGSLMIPAVAYGKNALKNKIFYDDEHGMFIVSNMELKAKDSRVKDSNLYLFFDRKSPELLKEQLFANTDNGKMHPRIIAKEDDFIHLRKEIVSDPYKKKWFASVKKDADALLEKPVKEYVISNSRLLDVSNEVINRVRTLALIYQLTEDEKYAKRCYEELEAVCNFKDWHPEHCLDTGIMSSAVGIGFDWIYNYMTEEQRKTLVDGAKKNGLVPAKQAYYGSASFNSFWVNTETNWGVIVNGGFATLAMAIAEYEPDYCMDILRNALCSIEKPWYRFAPDGSWYEGPGYWSFLGWNLATFMASYETAMGELYGADFMGLSKFGKYQAYFSDPDGVVNNFHDSGEGKVMDWMQFYMAGIYGQKDLMKHRVDEMEANKSTPSPMDILWYDVNATDSTEKMELSLDAYYRETEFVAMRENWGDKNGLWLSTHGGYSNNAHDHIDEGSFILNLGGVRWAVDLGSESLSYVDNSENPAILAGLNSYYFYKRKGEGHNIVVINPDDKLEMDQSKFAKVTPPVSGENAAFCSIDLSGHYQKNVNKYTRGYLISDGRRSFTMRDEIDLKKESEMYWFMHTKGNIAIIDDHTAVIFYQGKQLKVQFLTNASESQLFEMKAEKLPQSPQFKETANEGVNKLTCKLKGSGNVNITVKMSLMNEPASDMPPQDIPISQWTVEGANPYEYSYPQATINGISLDGRLIYGFKPNTFNYNYSLKESGEMPEITVEADCRTEILYYDGMGGVKLAEIRAYDENGGCNSYIIRFNPYSALNVGAYERHQVVGADVSSEQEGNERGGSYDGNMGTRWSADGKGEWIVHDLGSVKEIDAIGVALWMGGQRNFTFDILISDDGENFTKILSHVSAGKDEDIEIVPLEKRVTARFVKYLGYGNTTNNWNNVIELASLKKK